jgi:hypothetical protein
MPSPRLTEADRSELEQHGLTIAEVERQIAFCTSPRRYTRLTRPCTKGEGIRVVELAEIDRYLAAYEQAAKSLRLIKFVPASGAATRMFQDLSAILSRTPRMSRADIERAAAGGDAAAAAVSRLLAELQRLPFYDVLSSTLSGQGRRLEDPRSEADVRAILETILRRPGLGYGELPKALLPFHRYGPNVRTAFEEHLVDAVGYVRDSASACRVHFTISPEHLDGFTALQERTQAQYERTYGVRFEIGFSVQKPKTDSVALTPGGALFRTGEGSLLFRPGGHGALIENLGELDADVALIKNVDNISPDTLKEPNVVWSRILVGILTTTRARAFELLDRLTDRNDANAVSGALEFAREQFGAVPPATATAGGPSGLYEFARARLERPLRVCGMVRNEGEPGGGPFWVPDQGPQIVERSQIDSTEPAQVAIFSAATHFNPVSIACSLRDARGCRYDLSRYVDQSAGFVVEKWSEGRPLLAFERPGLWNGAMAGWNTIFVEVPPETFAPVKTVNDLLRPAHQALTH